MQENMNLIREIQDLRLKVAAAAKKIKMLQNGEKKTET